jgi:hypothetical protein
MKYIWITLFCLVGAVWAQEFPCSLSVQRYGSYSMLVTLNNPQNLRVAVRASHDLTETNLYEKWGYLFSTTNSSYQYVDAMVLARTNNSIYQVVLWPTNYQEIPPIPLQPPDVSPLLSL